MKRLFVALVCVLGLLSSCTTLDYLGRSYSPSGKVEIFFRTEDVPYVYEVMGTLEASPFLESTQNVQMKIEEEARRRGADAVLFTGNERVVTGSTSSTNSSGKEDNGKWQAKSETTTSNSTMEIIHAEFLKYKR